MGKSAANAQAHEQAQDAQIQQMSFQPVYAAPAPAAAPGTDVTAELQKLTQLRQSGVLTDAEFSQLNKNFWAYKIHQLAKEFRDTVPDKVMG